MILLKINNNNDIQIILLKMNNNLNNYIDNIAKNET